MPNPREGDRPILKGRRCWLLLLLMLLEAGPVDTKSVQRKRKNKDMPELQHIHKCQLRYETKEKLTFLHIETVARIKKTKNEVYERSQ